MIGLPEIAWKKAGWSKKSQNSYLVNHKLLKLGWPHKMTARLDLVGIYKQIVPTRQPEMAQKCIFLKIFGAFYGKTFTFSIFKKPFNGWNLSFPQNNSTVHLLDSVL